MTTGQKITLTAALGILHVGNFVSWPIRKAYQFISR